IQTALSAVKLMNSDKIKVANLKDALSDLNVPLKPEEQQMLEEMLDADEANELAKALDKVTSEKLSIDDIKHIAKGLGLHVPDEEFQKLEANVSVD
ncbi:EF-hand calcium-binding domain-containing protein 13, partial [Sigmodon hispidus]